MTRFLLAITAALVMMSSPLAAKAALPHSPARTTATAAVPYWDMAQADPQYKFPNRTTPQAVPVPAPTPVIVQTAPAAEPGVTGWTQLGLSGVIAALLGKLAFFPKASAGAEPKLSGKVGEIIGHLPAASIISDPNIRATVDAAVLHLIESGAPGDAIKVALSLIPGAGPIVSMLEPAFRRIAIKFMQDKVTAGGAVIVTDAAAPTDTLGTIARLVAQHNATTPALPGTAGDILGILAKLVAQHKPAAATV